MHRTGQHQERHRQRKRAAGLRQVTAHIPSEHAELIAKVQQDHGLKNRGEALARIIAASPLLKPYLEGEPIR